MKRLFPILFLLLLLPGSASAQVATQRITLTISITNRPVTSNTLVVNSSTRRWTNASTATTIQTNLVSTATSATNLYNQIANFPYSGGITPRWLTETSMALIAPLGGALAASQSGAWAILTLSTQSGPATFTALWPLENIAGPAVNKTNQASAFVSGLSAFSTNAFATNSPSIGNVLQKGAGPLQTVTGPVQLSGQVGTSISSQTNVSLYNSTNRGYVVAITNGYWTNGILGSPKTTNLVNYGNAISSPGTNGSNSEQFGAGARATNSQSTAFGAGSLALGADSTASGAGATAAASSASAFGAGANAAGLYSSAFGNVADVTGQNSIGIGQAVSIAHSNVVGIGNGVTSTTTNQVLLGTASYTTVVPGMLAVTGTQTNTIFSGTNKFQLAISYSVTNITSLANGANEIDPGFKTYIKVSGPSAAYSIDKIDKGYDGRVLTIQKTDSFTMTVVNNSGAGVLGDSAKILTGTGGTITITNNPGFVELIYDAAATRWGVRNKSQ